MDGEEHDGAKVSVQRSAGGVVFRPAPGTPAGAALLVGEQTDWNTGAENLRLPKGHLDPGESDEQAAIREVAEETGRAARILAALPSVSYRYTIERDGSIVDKTVAWFAMADIGPAAIARDEEMHAVHWISPEAALHELSFATERRLISVALEIYLRAHR